MNNKDFKFKNILIVTAGKINKNDSYNNGLLFRSLFSLWPKQNIAQIYNSADNGDEGFFDNYYQLAQYDRRFGKLYKKLYKTNAQLVVSQRSGVSDKNKHIGISLINKWFVKLKLLLNEYFVNSGLYELVFKPKLSDEMKKWINEFEPDFILMQGYSLTFSTLPLMIKEYKKIPLIFFTTDDWPSYLYNYKINKHPLLSYIPRMQVNKVVDSIIKQADFPIAFGQPMQNEYTKRYGKYFYYIIHADEPKRFEVAPAIRLYDLSVKTMIAIGSFNAYRCSLIEDFNAVCSILKEGGLNYRLALLSNQIEEKEFAKIKEMEFVDIYEDPGNIKLPSLLKGADLLVLIEGFDDEFAESIRLSISTKAHLFMFSKVPILVYANAKTGISNYASEYKWANTVNIRDLNLLLENIINLTQNETLRSKKINSAYDTAFQFHNIHNVQNYFYSLLLER